MGLVDVRGVPTSSPYLSVKFTFKFKAVRLIQVLQGHKLKFKDTKSKRFRLKEDRNYTRQTDNDLHLLIDHLYPNLP